VSEEKGLIVINIGEKQWALDMGASKTPMGKSYQWVFE
jgi:hypothetical protein